MLLLFYLTFYISFTQLCFDHVFTCVCLCVCIVRWSKTLSYVMICVSLRLFKYSAELLALKQVVLHFISTYTDMIHEFAVFF